MHGPHVEFRDLKFRQEERLKQAELDRVLRHSQQTSTKVTSGPSQHFRVPVRMLKAFWFQVKRARKGA
jgi:hypothetical protein